MNSFRFLERGIEAEIARQIEIWESGGTVVQETLHFDPVSGSLTPLRSKEEVHDYRYFPEPDLVPSCRPRRCSSARARRCPSCRPRGSSATESEYGLPGDVAGDAGRLERAGQLLRGERARPGDGDAGRDRAAGRPASWSPACASRASRTRASRSSRPAALAELVGMVESRALSQSAAKEVLAELTTNGRRPGGDRRGDGPRRRSPTRASWTRSWSARSRRTRRAVEQIRGGKAQAAGAIVGAVMKETKGRADGAEVNRLINEKLGI